MPLWMWQLPAVVLSLLTWLNAPSTSLADMSRREAVRRQLTAKPGRVYTVVGVPDETPPEVTPPVAGEKVPAPAATAAKPEPAHDEAWWRDRMAAARDARERDQVLSDAVQSRINALTNDFINRDDPAQKQQIASQRLRALEELDRLKKQIDADDKAIAAIIEDARQKNIPPGWIR